MQSDLATTLNDMFNRISTEPALSTRQFHAAKDSSKKPFVNNFKAYRKAHRAKKEV